jgi:hypothetical protein
MSTILKVEHRVGVKVPAEQLWDRLADFAAWSHWNAYEAEIDGALGFGAPLSLTERLPGHPERRATVRLGDWTPHAQLIWHERRGWQFRATRYFEIEELVPGSCILANGLIVGGLRGEFWFDRHRRGLREAYAEIGEGLRRLVEG